MDKTNKLIEKVKEEKDKYSKAAAAIEKFYTDASKRKVSEKYFTII